MASEKTADHKPAGKRLFLKLGCGLFALLCVFVIAVYVSGDSLLRATAEKLASSETGVPVTFGKLRLNLVGRPSVSLHNVKIGSRPIASFEQITITVNSLDTLTDAESVVVNVDCGGIGINVPDDPGKEGTEFKALLDKMAYSGKKSSAKWAFPSFKLRAFTLDMPAGKGKRSKISFDAFEVNGMSSEGLSRDYPEAEFSLRNARVQVEDKALFQVDLLSGTAGNSQDKISISRISAESVIFKDGLDLSDDLALTGLLAALQEISPQKKDDLKESLPLSIAQVRVKSVAVDVTGKPSAGKDTFSFRARDLYIDKILRQEEFSAVKGLQLESVKFAGAAGAQNVEVSLKGMAVSAERKSAASILPAVSFSVENLDFLAGRESVPAAVKIQGAALVVPEHAEGQRDIYVEILKVSKAQFDLPVEVHKGFILPAYLASYFDYLQRNYLPVSAVKPAGAAESSQGIKISDLDLSSLSVAAAESKGGKLYPLFNCSAGSILLKDFRYSSDLPEPVSCPSVVVSEVRFSSEAEQSGVVLSVESLSASESSRKNLTFFNNIDMKGISCRQKSKSSLLQDEISLGAVSVRGIAAGDSNAIDSISINNLAGKVSLTKEKGFALEHSMNAVMDRIASCMQPPQEALPAVGKADEIKINDISGGNIRLTFRAAAQGKEVSAIDFLLSQFEVNDFSSKADIQKAAAVRADNCNLNFYNSQKEGGQLAFSKIRAADFLYPLVKGNGDKSDYKLSGLTYRKGGTAEKAFASAGEIYLTCASTSPLVFNRVDLSGVDSRLKYLSSGRWDIVDNLQIITEVMDQFSFDVEQKGRGQQKKPFSFETGRFICKTAAVQLQAETESGIKQINLSPGELDISNIILLEHNGKSRIYVGEARSKLANVEFSAAGRKHYVSSENIVLDQFDSYRLEKGTASTVFSIKGWKFGKAKKGSPPELLAIYDNMDISIQEFSEKRSIIKYLRFANPRLMAELYKGKEVKISPALQDLEDVLSAFAVQQKEQAPPKRTPFFMSQLLLSDGIINMRKLPEAKSGKTVTYRVSDINIKGSSLAEYINAVGSLNAAAVLSSADISSRTSNIKFNLNELAMPLGFNKADFVLDAVAEKLPVELIAEDAAKNGVILSGPEGYIQFSMDGASRKGKLDIYGDLLFDKLKVKIDPRNRKNVGNLGAALSLFVTTIVPSVSLNDKIIDKVCHIGGTIEKPVFKSYDMKIWDTLLDIIKNEVKKANLLKQQSKDAAGQESPQQEPVEDGTQPVKKSSNPLLDILNKGGIIPGAKKPETASEEEAGQEPVEKEPTKEERRMNRIKSAIDIFQGIMKKEK
ncbi:MAG: hypothetical protein ACYTFY_03495 [Planctomycetota bacterium]